MIYVMCFICDMLYLCLDIGFGMFDKVFWLIWKMKK